MKKLSLKNLKLEANDLLQREQLKSVFGGYGGYDGGGSNCLGGCSTGHTMILENCGTAWDIACRAVGGSPSGICVC